MKTSSLNPSACLFCFLPIALPYDSGAMEDCWSVGDIPRSRLFSFALLISIFLLPHVENFAVAPCFFRRLLKKNGNYQRLPDEQPISFTTEKNLLLFTTSTTFCAKEISCCFHVLKVIEKQILKNGDVFSFITTNFYAFIPKAPFDQIVVHDLKTALAFDFCFEKKRNQINPPNGCFFLVYHPFTQTFFWQLVWQAIFFTSAFS